MKFKIASLFIITFILMLSLTAVGASEDISQNATLQTSLDEEDAVVSDFIYYTDTFPSSEHAVTALEGENKTRYQELTYTVGPSSPYIAGNISVNVSAKDGLKVMMYSSSKGTYNPATGIWDIGEFYEMEKLMLFSYNESSYCLWENFIKSEPYSNILKEFTDLNQTNKLVNPDADDRMPYYVDLMLTENQLPISARWSDESDVVEVIRSFRVESKWGIAENTTVEYHIGNNFTLEYYNATKGTYNETTGIWNVGDVYGPENLTVYLAIDKEYFISKATELLGGVNAIAKTTTTEINPLNNIVSTAGMVTPTSNSDMYHHEYTEDFFYDYSDYRTVEVEENGETKEISYEEYKGSSNNQQNNSSDDGQTNMNGTDNPQNEDSENNQTILNGTDNQQNATNTTVAGNLSNVDKSISLSSNNNIWIVLAVLILCAAGVAAYKKFRS